MSKKGNRPPVEQSRKNRAGRAEQINEGRKSEKYESRADGRKSRRKEYQTEQRADGMFEEINSEKKKAGPSRSEQEVPSRAEQKQSGT